MEPHAQDMAIAIRMGACRPPPGGAPGAAPIMTWHAQAPVVQGEDGLSFPADATPEAVAKGVEEFRARHGRPPRTVVVKRLGVSVRDDRPDPVSRPRLGGVVALVTGAAQGLGRGVAEEMAAEGARLLIGDINVPAAEAAAAELNARFGANTAAGTRLDVASLESACAAAAEAVQRFGGLDLLVANAGVLKAGGLEEMDEAAFDLVTSVNYKGFFLCVKAVAPVMKLQHRHHPGHVMDIIQVNSKSGLEGSNRNFAYAGSKFGGIGLAQSFALELISANIKVNAICPGNYFDGPLWSDPQHGLFVQYLRAGKVAGAKTIDDVRAFYTSKVPMRRGVTPADVARAIVYLHEQQYETGQALPVTGGQVMLR